MSPLDVSIKINNQSHQGDHHRIGKCHATEMTRWFLLNQHVIGSYSRVIALN